MHGRWIRDVFPYNIILGLTHTSVNEDVLLPLVERFRQNNLRRDGFEKYLPMGKQLVDMAPDLDVTVQTTVDQRLVKMNRVDTANAQSRGVLQSITGYLNTTAIVGGGKMSSIDAQNNYACPG